ncbi:MAG: arginine--tRNA ligase [Clostridia bacterium]|nr:arginine--tRNA ligase [Clostridia bacterium]
MDAKQNLANAIAPLCGMDASAILDWFEVPKKAEMGDYAFPCFRLSKVLRKAPAAIASELKEQLVLPSGFSKAEAVGPYLNFYVDTASQAGSVLQKVLSEKENYGSSKIGSGKTVCVEYSSINIAKPFGFHHLPSTAIGNALYRIYKFLGYRTIGINHLGDWGTQFGKMITAYKLWGSKPIDDYSIRELVSLYVRFHEEAEKDPSLNDTARAWFHKIESNDPEAMELWAKMKDNTIREVKVTYHRMGIDFDSWAGESFYEDKMGAIIQELRDKGISKLDQGAEIVDLSEWNMPPCIIVKSDGSTIYATRDIAAACYRKQEYDFCKSLYVVAYQQDLHFRQFFKVLELMGREWVKDCTHVNFGMVSMEDASFSTRSGNILYLDDILQAAVDKTYAIICEKSPDLEDKQSAAESVGVGAILWSVLYNNRIKDVSFTWDKILNFDGETAPYVQYTHARCCSVLRKAEDFDFSSPDASLLDDPYAQTLLKALDAFPAAVLSAADKNEPYVVSRCIMSVASAFNKFYYEQRIMADDPAVKAARLALTDATRQVLANGLNLLGIQAPERM